MLKNCARPAGWRSFPPRGIEKPKVPAGVGFSPRKQPQAARPGPSGVIGPDFPVLEKGRNPIQQMMNVEYAALF